MKHESFCSAEYTPSPTMEGPTVLPEPIIVPKEDRPIINEDQKAQETNKESHSEKKQEQANKKINGFILKLKTQHKNIN